MRLKKVEIIKYRNFENIQIDFEKSNFSSVYTVASINGGGKSTLLQFIFIMLHCFMDDNKKVYIQNLLESFFNISEGIELVKFIIEEDGKKYTLNFSIEINENKKFNLYLDLKILDNRLKKAKKELTENKKDNDRNRELTLQKFISDLELQYYEIRKDLDELEAKLTKLNIKYITHLSKNQIYKNVLLLHTEMSKKLLKKLTKKIFLTAPSSQVFLFLSNKDKQRIFSSFNESFSTYYQKLEDTKSHLYNFFTYDFASTEIILESFQKASHEDVKIKRKTKKYGTKYDELTDELKNFLEDKEISENESGDRVIFKLKDTQTELSPEDLSHGELKKLGIYIWLKYIVEEGSIVLMDEIDIALHPKWQYELVKDLITWSKDSQFLLATHSPQILSSTYYKNIIKLEDGKVKRYNNPPIDRDINAIIVEIMEAPSFPQDLLELHKKYRKLINDEKVNTDEAKKLKEEILEYESESSSFFQDINFHLELM